MVFTTSVQSNCAGCTQTIETSNISSSGSGYQTSCSQTAYPACQTPCVQYWCKTTRDDYCQLSGPFTTNQAGTVGGFITVCSTGSSNPYTCVAPPYFAFFPPFFPFFPPYFAPSPYFPFFPPFFPFFPPFFPTNRICAEYQRYQYLGGCNPSVYCASGGVGSTC